MIHQNSGYTTWFFKHSAGTLAGAALVTRAGSVNAANVRGLEAVNAGIISVCGGLMPAWIVDWWRRR